MELVTQHFLQLLRVTVRVLVPQATIRFIWGQRQDRRVTQALVPILL